MTQSFLRYPLQDGYIHNWLVAGPQLIAIDRSDASSAQQVSACAPSDSGIVETPCERAQFTSAGPAGGVSQLMWRYLGCDDDHLVDLTGAYPSPHALRAWAYSEVVAPANLSTCLTLHSFGPVQVWLNGHLAVHHQGHDERTLYRLEIEFNLVKGSNAILVRLEQPRGDSTPLAIALQLCGAGHPRLRVRIPTRNRNPQLHQAVERLARRAYLERDLYAGPEALYIKWPATLRAQRRLLLRVQKPSGDIVGEAQPVVSAGLSQHLLEGTWVKDGRYQVKVLPDFEEFIQGLRVSRDLEVNLLHSSYRDEPQGEQGERAIELLQHAAWWTDGIYAELAAMALGLWKQVNAKAILRAINEVLAQQAGCDELLAGLLFMAYRYADHPSFPPSLIAPLEECLLGYDYRANTETAHRIQGLDDDGAIVRHACSILAGQRYPTRRFLWSGRSGSWHQADGEQRALAWLTRRAQGGFAAWDSGEGFAAMLLGLVALVDHAASETLSELAAATVDKLLFTLAISSFRGVFGSTHGATSAASITDARMEPTAGISRLLWGVGCWNQHMAAAYALATSSKYVCPPVHQMIALDRPVALWARERHITAWRDINDEPVADQEINKVTYKTPDYMLCSAQDYRAGAAGSVEHIWQATLGPSAVIFVNHPRCLNQKDAYPANFWRGNGVLPRVAQWRDLLIALHQLPAGDWLGYTHAHFPIAAFDAYTLRQGWAFARKGDAYLALTASAGMHLIKVGPGAFRELRSVGRQNVWLCQMGRAAQDGSFAEFQRAVLNLPLRFDGLGVSLVSLRGDAVAFDWSGPFQVQGKVQALGGFPHYASPHCTCALGSTEMDIRFEDWTLRLDLDPAEQ